MFFTALHKANFWRRLRCKSTGVPKTRENLGILKKLFRMHLLHTKILNPLAQSVRIRTFFYRF
jgi:hypothetical protein